MAELAIQSSQAVVADIVIHSDGSMTGSPEAISAVKEFLQFRAAQKFFFGDQK